MRDSKRTGRQAIRKKHGSYSSYWSQDDSTHAEWTKNFSLQLLFYACHESGKNAPSSSSSSQLSSRVAALLPVVSASIAIQFDMA